MTQKEQIRQEIERRKKKHMNEDLPISIGRYYEDRDLLSFIDSLPEETSYDTNKLTPTPSVNIEDVARVQFASHAHIFDRKRKAVFDWQQFKEVVGIFYGFGKRDSLPEEKATCKTCGFYENNCPFIRGKLIPYPNKVCKDYTYSAMKEQEKPSEDLEEAAGLYLDSHKPLTRYNWGDLQDAFIAGAEWMRKKDVEDMYMSDNRHFLKCYEQGKVDMKVEMMKDAVEGTLGYGPHLQRPIIMLEQVPDIWNGSCQSVKIIIVKQ